MLGPPLVLPIGCDGSVCLVGSYGIRLIWDVAEADPATDATEVLPLPLVVCLDELGPLGPPVVGIRGGNTGERRDMFEACMEASRVRSWACCAWRRALETTCLSEARRLGLGSLLMAAWRCA